MLAPHCVTSLHESFGIDMTGEHCGYLIAVAMANRLHEVWISRNPILLFTYIVQYMPTTAKW